MTKPTYKVIYGETRGTWSRQFTSWTETARCIRSRVRCGDRIFSVTWGTEHPKSFLEELEEAATAQPGEMPW